MKIYAWNENSEGAKALSKTMGIKRIKHEGSKFKGSPDKMVINWGSSILPPEIMKCKIVNPPNVIMSCSDKLKFFNKISEKEAVLIPDWTDSFETAMTWIADGHTVCARKVLNGHSAQGLVLMEPDKPETFCQAPLYTKYIPKKHEFRVHVVKGEIIDVQRKAKKNDFEGEVNWKVRNLANGFIYAREGFETPEVVKQQGLAAVAAIGLNFGAVDIIYNATGNKAYVLEVNTAPGLMGTTLELYANALKDFE